MLPSISINYNYSKHCFALFIHLGVVHLVMEDMEEALAEISRLKQVEQGLLDLLMPTLE